MPFYPLCTCPLCCGEETRFLLEKKGRIFHHCQECDFIFVPATFFLSTEDEQAHYATHKNSPADLNYRKFLSRLAEPLLAQIQPGSHGLDFGCGPGPTLSVMFEEAGHSMDLFDCYYANNPEVFERCYDFISATEVFEHLHHPKSELERLFSILKPQGLLGVMTMHPPALCNFEHWHYIIDPTHVCFYSGKTFRWISERFGVRLEIPGKDLAIFHKI